jgi:hypothetical protein
VPTYEVQERLAQWQQAAGDGLPLAAERNAGPINDFATLPSIPATGQKEMWDNFMGSPSAQFVFAVPQDGIAAPADFNASASGYLRKIWDGTATARARASSPGRTATASTP